MKRLFIVLVASLVLGLVGGVGSALASDLLPPPPNETATPSQSATQSNDGSNTADQSGTSLPVVTSGPNIAIANGSSCNPCGDSGTTNQNSGNTVDASNTNTATQTNTQSNGAGQTQTAGQGSGATQSADQSNTGENTADQSGTSTPVVVSGPNVAVLNSGDVNQNSGNNVDASNTNTANQSNTQQNGAGQSQTVAGTNGCCSSDGASQSASQSNEGSNEANQSGTSAPVVVSGPNVAVLNKGDVNQNSGNNVDASNTNTANQSNTQQNGAGQSQTVAGTNGCCHSGGASQSADQSNSGSNTANQSGYSAPVVTSGPNIAVGNGWVHDACNPCAPAGGNVNQNSGNWVDASNHNTATQSNNQSNGLGQVQSVSGPTGGCCGTGDVSQSATQSNSGSNTANQSGTSAPYVKSGGNLAALNGGAVNQNSGNWVDASNHNTATQRNNQSNGLGQRQTVSGAGSGCCGAGDVSQSADQSNWAENTANQSGRSAPVVTSGHNVAFANAGPINQNSGNWVDASNHNTATQSNNQSNGLGQSQTVSGAGSGCCGAGDVSQSADQSNSAENTANQSGYSAPVVTSGHNVAFLDHGGPRQNSGNVVNASNHNTAGQSNNQSNSLGQHQSVNRGGCCPPAPCEPSCEPKCPPEPCEPRCPPNPCEHECEPRCEPNPCGPVLTTPRGGLGVI